MDAVEDGSAEEPLSRSKTVHEALVDVLLEIDELDMELVRHGNEVEPNIGVATLRELGQRILDVEAEMDKVSKVVERRVQVLSYAEAEAVLTRLSRVRDSVTRTVVWTAGLLGELEGGDSQRYKRAAAVWRRGELRRLCETGEGDVEVCDEAEGPVSNAWSRPRHSVEEWKHGDEMSEESEVEADELEGSETEV